MDRFILHAMLKDMLLARSFEERAAREYREGNIAGFLHLNPFLEGRSRSREVIDQQVIPCVSTVIQVTLFSSTNLYDASRDEHG